MLALILLTNRTTGRTFDDASPSFQAPTTHPSHSVPHPPETVPEATDSNVATLSPQASSSDPNVPHPDKPTCFYVDKKVCTDPRPIVHNVSTNCAECFAYNIDSIVCCNVTNIEHALGCMLNNGKDSSHHWVNLHIRNATLEHFDISHGHLKNLHSLSITDGNIPHIINQFSRFSKERCFNVSNNNLLTIDPRPFTYLSHLEVLDMSYNNLTTMPPLSSTRKMSLHIRYGTLTSNHLIFKLKYLYH